MPRRVPAWALLLVLAGVLLQGFYAGWLNRLYYSRYAPFFDSMSYLSDLAAVIAASKSGGIPAGLRAAFGESTVSLPWIVAAVLGPVLPYSRLVGIWMQEFWIATLGVSLLIYWRVYRGAPIGLALLWTIPPISFTAIYRVDGGVSDFRMDLSLYLFFALVVIWYLATRETESRAPWILSGVFICLCCLNRATSPAYLGVTLGPLLVARWLMQPGQRALLVKRVGLIWIPGAVIGLIPVAKNWDYVHYYYFVWGADPNAHLPWSESLKHFDLAEQSMGFTVMVAALLLLAAQSMSKPRNFDWPLLWIACAPALLLSATGAGLNPYVSMPSVFGALLLGMAPYKGSPRTHGAVWVFSALLALICIGQTRGGYREHAGKMDGTVASINALKEGIVRMQNESRRLGLHSAQFVTAHLADYQMSALHNVLIYDMGAVPLPDRKASRLSDGLVLIRDHEKLFGAEVPVAWDRVPGTSDDDRFRYLAAFANREITFFFMPDDATLSWLERERGFYFINGKMRQLKERVLGSGEWRKLGAPLRISNNETVELYFNDRMAVAK